jgi:hypothetical protein
VWNIIGVLKIKENNLQVLVPVRMQELMVSNELNSRFDFCFPYVAACSVWSCMMLKVNMGELKNTGHLCRA